MDPMIESEHPSRLRRRFARRRAIACIAIGLACSWAAYAAVVSMQQPTRTGGMVETPVLLYTDERDPVSGIVFDVHYDPARFELVGITPGGAATDAGKEIVVSAPRAGSGRVLITGFNDTALYDGHVATIVLRPLQAGMSPEGLTLDRALATDPFGNAVNLDIEDLLNPPPASPDKIAAPREEEGGVEEPLEDFGSEGSPEAADSVAEAAEATDGAPERSTASGPGALALDDPSGPAADRGPGAPVTRAAGTWVDRVPPESERPPRSDVSTVRQGFAPSAPGTGIPAPAAGSEPAGTSGEAGRPGAYGRAPEAAGSAASAPPDARLALAAPIAAPRAPVASGDVSTLGNPADTAAYPRSAALIVTGVAALLFVLLFAGRAGLIAPGRARRGRR
ncbi:MAG: hypothetical protein KF886_20330 [Candidatus Hydrogenedentes bacterium]|nr:hypothetical protein [Candidatus Hydrogenedentota bacterium]